MSAFPLEADVSSCPGDVSFVPFSDIVAASMDLRFGGLAAYVLLE
jgi:hypothetical protein